MAQIIPLLDHRLHTCTNFNFKSSYIYMTKNAGLALSHSSDVK